MLRLIDGFITIELYPFHLLSASPLQTRHKICTIVITSVHVYFQSTGRESWERQVSSMSSDTPLVVNLEVTVPRIILAKDPSRPGWRGTATSEQSSEYSQSEDVGEQVRIVPLDQPTARLSALQLEGTSAESRMIHTMPFRLFRLKVPNQAQAFLLQVFRRRGRFINEKRQKTPGSDIESLYLSDEMALSIEIRHTGEPGSEPDKTPTEPTITTPAPPIIAGKNRVILYLNGEGTPESYSIDGVES
jgi:hypothetical protein